VTDWLELLAKERKVIKATPIHFITACLIAAIILGILWYSAFSIALGIQKSTVEAYKNRFGDLSNPKDFASTDDVSKFFVSQTCTNFDGTNLVLDYEPIPYSIQILSPHFLSPSVLMERWGYIRKKTFVFTNGWQYQLSNDFRSGEARVQYFRKSIH
jgi:hypothetical protein